MTRHGATLLLCLLLQAASEPGGGSPRRELAGLLRALRTTAALDGTTPEVQDLRTAALQFLKHGYGSEQEGSIFGSAYVQGKHYSGLCRSYAKTSEGVRTMDQLALWDLGSSLRSCGVPGVRDAWPRREEEWSVMRLQSGNDLESLSEVRRDAVSLTCRRSVQIERPDEKEEDEEEQGTAASQEEMSVQSDDADIVDMDDANQTEEPQTPKPQASIKAKRVKSPRCPRCGRAVAVDKAFQAGLLSVHRRFLDAAEKVSASSTFGQRSAACTGATEQAQAKLQAAWDSGGASALLAALDRLGCGRCELEGASQLDRGAAAKAEIRAFAALAEVRCSAESLEPTAAAEARLAEALHVLEEALWLGLAFPLLHEAASRAALKLRSIGRLLPQVSPARLCKALHNPDSALQMPAPLQPESLTMNPVAEVEQKMLRQWGSKEPGQSWDPLSMGLAYLELAAASEKTLFSSQALALGALWLRRAAEDIMLARGTDVAWLSAELRQSGDEAIVRSFIGAVSLIVRAAYQAAVSDLMPGTQFLVLSTCLQALRSHEDSSVHQKSLWYLVESRLHFIAQQNPFLSPPIPMLADVQQVSRIAERLHTSFTLQLQTKSSEDMPYAPHAAGAAHLSLFEVKAASGDSSAASALHGLAAMAALRDLAQKAPEPKHSAQAQQSSRQESIAEIRGLRLHERSGLAELLLRRQHIEEADAGELFAEWTLKVKGTTRKDKTSIHKGLPPQLVSEVISLGSSSTREAIGASLDLPSEVTTELSQHPQRERHPLRRLTVAGLAVAGGGLHSLLRQAMLELQQLASQQVGTGSLVLQCANVGFQVRQGEWGGTLDVLLGDSQVELVVEEQTSNEHSDSQQWHRFAAEVTAALKSSSPLVEGLARLRSVCAARAAARLLATPISSLAAGQVIPAAPPSSAGDDRMQSSALLSAREGLAKSRLDMWLSRLAGIHEALLRALGFQNMDPGSCWDGKMFTFASCCSVGDNHNSCWFAGYSDERCCKPLSPPELVSREVVSYAIDRLAEQACKVPATEVLAGRIAPAVAAWLSSPNGRNKLDGRTFSSLAADVLDETVAPCDQQSEEARQGGGETASTDSSFRLHEWVPGPSAGSGPRLRIFLEPVLRTLGPDSAAPLDPSLLQSGALEAVAPEIIHRRAQEPVLSPESARLATIEPRVRTLQRLRLMLKRLQAKRGGKAKAHDQRESASLHPAEHDKELNPDRCCGSWASFSADTESLAPGRRLQVRQRKEGGGQSWLQLELLDVLSVVRKDLGGQQLLHRARVLTARADGPLAQQHVTYYDLSERSLDVEVMRLPEGCQLNSCSLAAEAGDGRQKLKQTPVWPDCITHAQTLRGTASAGVFVNLAVYGITDGCFRDDCTYSDHFSSGSPATCAKTCAAIRACRWWSFWTSRSGGTCWLRRHDEHRDSMLESMTGSTDCVPPVAVPLGSTSASKQPGELTLFQLAGRAARRLEPGQPAHQWDVLKVLEEFGHLTPSQLEQKGDTHLRRSALRLVTSLRAAAQQ